MIRAMIITLLAEMSHVYHRRCNAVVALAKCCGLRIEQQYWDLKGNANLWRFFECVEPQVQSYFKDLLLKLEIAS